MACPSPTPTPLAPELSLPPCGPSRRKTAAARRPLRARTRATPGDAAAAAAAAAATEQDESTKKGEEDMPEVRHPVPGQLPHRLRPCAFHGHITGEKGLFPLSPPHQGIDGECSDKSGVIVYRWNDRGSRPNTGRDNRRRRWSRCQERDEDAPPRMTRLLQSYEATTTASPSSS